MADEALKPVVKSVDMKDDMRVYAEKVRLIFCTSPTAALE